MVLGQNVSGVPDLALQNRLTTTKHVIYKNQRYTATTTNNEIMIQSPYSPRDSGLQLQHLCLALSTLLFN